MRGINEVGMKRQLLVGIGALAAIFGLALVASANPAASVAIEMAQQVSAVGPGFTESWAKTCTTTASVIVPATARAVIAFECAAPEVGETDATQFVAIGNSAIGDPAFATRTSPIICGSGCAQTSKAINARQAYCRSDTDDVVLYCWGISSNVSQP